MGIKTTVITPTIGTPLLRDAIISVQEQSVRCRHLVVVDGPVHERPVRRILDETAFYGDVIVLPENTGGEWNGHRWNGHRIYAGIPAIVNTEYVSFLDEDNWYEEDFVEVMEGVLEQGNRYVATCRRKIFHYKEYIGVDKFESIGKNDLGYTLHDTNTFMFSVIYYNKTLSRYFYNPLGADKVVSEMVLKLKIPQRHIRDPLVNYRCPDRLVEFFKKNCDKQSLT